MKKRLIFLAALLVLICTVPSCSLSLSGASIPPDMKTVDVELFENNALLVYGPLSQQFTESLKDRIRSQTRLNIIRNPEADAMFTGSITTYSIAPVSVQATGTNNAPPIANASRLTITINVKYVNKKDAKNSFEQPFTRTADFTGDISAKEAQLVSDINKQLTEDIFNRAFANWN